MAPKLIKEEYRSAPREKGADPRDDRAYRSAYAARDDPLRPMKGAYDPHAAHHPPSHWIVWAARPKPLFDNNGSSSSLLTLEGG